MTTGKHNSTVPTLRSRLYQKDKTSPFLGIRNMWCMIRCMHVSVGCGVQCGSPSY